MAKISPFRGYRPRPDVVADVASPPYDVLSRAEARQLIDANPLTFMRVLRADALVDGAEQGDGKDQRVYDTARANLDQLIDEGVLLRDESPCLYLYNLTMGTHTQSGVVAGVSTAEYFAGKIKKHEHTRDKDLADRMRHIETLGVNTGPVFLTYRALPRLDRLVAHLSSAEPAYDFRADDGVRHRFWVVSSPNDIQALIDGFADVPAIYIADGHHRTEAGSQVAKRLSERHDDPAAAALLAVVFPDNQVQVLPYNRVVRDLNGHSPRSLIEALGERFTVDETEHAEPNEIHTFGMFVAGKWYRLVAKPGSFDHNDRQASLDCAILQNNVLAPLLAIEDPRKSPRIEFVGGIRGNRELELRAAAYDGVAFCLYPTPIKQVMEIADANEVMPPKSTWVEPKLRSGVIVRSLVE